MNMEVMTFPDASFDAVTMAHTLAYSKDTFKTLSEVARILKTGGRFVFHASYVPDSKEWPGNKISGQEIWNILKDLNFDLIFHSFLDKVTAVGDKAAIHTFCVRKKETENPCFDPIEF